MERKITEHDIQKTILDWLRTKHIMAFRMQSSFVTAEYKGKKRAFRCGVVGISDILAFKKMGSDAPVFMPLFIECKAPNGKQSAAQKEFQAEVEAEGMVYILARSVEDVQKYL